MNSTINLIINGVDQGASAALQGVQGALGSVGGAFTAVGTMAIAGAAVAGSAIVGLGVAGVNSFIQFEGAMNEVFTLMPGISQQAMGAMQQDVMALSREFGVLPDEVVPALYQSLSAGVPASNVFEFLEIATQASIGGVTDLETAVDGITSTVNAYGPSVMDAARASDIMFTTVRLGKTDFGQLSGSLFNVLPVASSLGVAFEDVGAALATVTAQGVPTSVATTQLRQLFVELSQEGGKASDLFKEIAGVSFKQFVAEGGNVQDALQIMEQASIDMGVGINDLFGSVEAGGAALALTGSATETFSANLAEMANASGATGAAYETMNQGLGRSIDRLKAFGNTALIEVGSALSPLINQVLTFAEGALPVISGVLNNTVIPALQTGAAAIGQFFALISQGVEPLGALDAVLSQTFGPEVGDIVNTIREVIQQLWDTIQPGIDTVVGLAAQFVTWQDVLTVLGVAVASVVLPVIGSLIVSILSVAAPIVAAIAIVALLRTAWETNWGGIQEKTATAIEFVRNVITTVATGIQTFWAAHGDAIKTKASEIWTAIQTAVSTAITTVQTIVTTVATALQTFWATHGEAIKTKASEIWTAIQTAVSTAITAVQTIVTTVATALQTFWDAHGELVLATAQRIWDTIQQYISGVWDTISALFAAFKSAFEGDWEGFGANLRVAWDTAWQTIVDYLRNLWGIVAPILAEFVFSAINYLQDVDWGGVGTNIIQGVANGISGAVGIIADAARAAAQAALDAAKAFLGISSPARVPAALLGKPFAEGFGMGVTDEMPNTARQIQRSIGATVNELDVPGRGTDGLFSSPTLRTAPAPAQPVIINHTYHVKIEDTRAMALFLDYLQNIGGQTALEALG